MQSDSSSKQRVKTLGKRKFIMLQSEESLAKPATDTATSSSAPNPNDSFIPGSIPNFWQCRHCQHIPVPLRARHSVLFHASTTDDKGDAIPNPTPPTIHDYPIIRVHLQSCNAMCKRWEMYKDNIEELKKKDEEMARRLKDFESDSDCDCEDDGEENEYLYGEVDTPKRRGRGRRRGARRSSPPTRFPQKDESNADKPKGKRPRGRPRKKKKEDKENIAPTSSLSNSSTSHSKSKQKKDQSTSNPVKKIDVIDSSTPLVIPDCYNGLVDVKNDLQVTPTIDVLLCTHLATCTYAIEEDLTPYLRQKPLPKGYPGVECIYCKPTTEAKKWFFNSPKQLSTGFPKIEQHLAECPNFPMSRSRDLARAKKQEDGERAVLREKLSRRVTRRDYARVVFDRLGAKEIA